MQTASVIFPFQQSSSLRCSTSRTWSHAGTRAGSSNAWQLYRSTLART